MPKTTNKKTPPDTVAAEEIRWGSQIPLVIDFNMKSVYFQVEYVVYRMMM